MPQHIAERASLHAGDYMYVRLLDSGDIVIRPVNEREVHSGYATDGAQSQITNKAPAAEEKW
ncbi:MAG: hypothetical protein HZA63_06675 [Rhodocyclales bacterium]|nr:hypothetical protein [Rhodocyclales bacterium]